MAIESKIDELVARGLVERCAPNFKRCGLPSVVTLDAVGTKTIQRLWTGMGGIDEVLVTVNGGVQSSFVAKHIGTPANLENHGHRRDYDSYTVECCFYECGHSDRLCAAGASCPKHIFIDRADEGVVRICMTKLPGDDLERDDLTQIRATLVWMARLHALYWGTTRADIAVASGLQPQGCYWHFDTRQEELEKIPSDGIDGRLKLAASGLDARMKADAMQTICHGDAKAANVMFDAERGVALLDFQWIGKAPPTKDLAYFLACGADISPDAQDEHLRFYLEELSTLLSTQGDKPPSFEQLRDSYALACTDLARWMAGWGWWGNAELLRAHVALVLDRVDGGRQLCSEEECRKRLFSAFPAVSAVEPAPVRGKAKAQASSPAAGPGRHVGGASAKAVAASAASRPGRASVAPGKASAKALAKVAMRAPGLRR